MSVARHRAATRPVWSRFSARPCWLRTHVDDIVHLAYTQLKTLLASRASDKEPPGYWLVAWGLPAAAFSHQDASALCLMRATARPGEPVETDRA